MKGCARDVNRSRVLWDAGGKGGESGVRLGVGVVEMKGVGGGGVGIGDCEIEGSGFGGFGVKRGGECDGGVMSDTEP